MSLEGLGAGEQWLLLAVLCVCVAGACAGIAHFIAARHRYRARWVTRLDDINAQRSRSYASGFRRYHRHYW